MATDKSSNEPPMSNRSSVENKAQPPPLDDLLKVIPHALLDEQCSEILLCDVAKMLTDWQLLRPYLKMNKSDENDLIRNHPGNNAVQKQKLLQHWQEKFGKGATHNALVSAIYKMGDIECAWEVCQMVAKSLSAKPTPSTTSSSSSSLFEAIGTTSAASPAIRSYRDQLKLGYRTHEPVMIMEWPPPPTLKFISLAMIKKKKIETGKITDEYIRTMIHGNLDDFLHKKVPVEVDQFFSLDSKQHKVILVEGAPGSGKSTLLWHISQKWQSGELFQQFTLVLLILLRDTAVHTAQSLADILPCVPSRSSKYTPSEYRKAIASDIEDRHGEGVLIMLDGWDEVPTDLQQEGSLLHDIIAEPSKCSIQAAAVIVSSRPLASHGIRKHVSSRVEVLGFTRERREEYIQDALQDEPEAALSLLQQIECVPQLGENCHLPLNLAIITHTFLCSYNTLPSTYCQIIIKLAQSCLLHHIQKSTPQVIAVKSLESFSDLPDGTREEFIKLCKVAYEGVVQEKYSFSSKDLKEMTLSSTTGVSQITTLGLLKAVHSLVATGSSTVYHFLHLSLQELCAAYHITTLPSPEHIKKIIAIENPKGNSPQYTLRAHFQSVCQFYSALTNFLHEPQVVSQLLDIYKKKDYDTDCERIWETHHVIKCHCASFKRESFFECLAEADNQNLKANIIGTQVEIGHPYIGQALASVIKQAHHLKSVSCFGFTSTLSKALLEKKSLKHLQIYIDISFRSLPILPIDMECIKHVLATCKNLEHFAIKSHRHKLTDTKVFTLAVALNHTSLQEIDISGCEIEKEGMVALCSAFKTNTTLKCLKICTNRFGDEGASHLAVALSHLSLQEIVISYCDINSGMVALSSALKANTTLKCLNVRGNKFGDKGASHLAEALSHASLQEINIKDCGIEEDGIVALSSTLKTNTTLKCLNVSRNKFGDKGASHFAEALSHTSLQKININKCDIGEDGTVALSSALKTNTTLKVSKG